MNYVFKRGLAEMKQNKAKLLIFFVLYVFILLYIAHTYNYDKELLLGYLYGWEAYESASIIVHIAKLFKIGFLLYIFYSYFISDYLYGKVNIFMRMTLKKWFRFKVLIAFIIALVISLFQLGMFSVFSRNYSFGMIGNDFLFLLELGYLTFLIILNKNIVLKVLCSILLGVLIFVFMVNEYIYILYFLGITLLFLCAISYLRLSNKSVNFK